MLTLVLIGVLLACFVPIMPALLVGIKFSKRLHKLERSQMMLAVLLLAEVEKPLLGLRGDAILSLFRTQMTHRKGGEMIYEISQVSLLDNDVRDAPDGPFDTFEEAQQLAKEYA